MRRFKMETLVRDKLPGRIKELGGRARLRKLTRTMDKELG